MNDDRLAIPESMIVYLPPSLYEAAEREGVDMRYYRKTEPLPTTTYQRLNFGPELS